MCVEVCLAHALMTEREEVMGLLLGQVEGTEARRLRQRQIIFVSFLVYDYRPYNSYIIRY